MRKAAEKEGKPDAKPAEEFLKKVGQRMADLRKKKGYNNYEIFAYTHNISRAQYGRYEKGKDLNMSSFKKVLDALEVTPSEFFKKGFE